jgi:hypothetical protein
MKRGPLAATHRALFPITFAGEAGMAESCSVVMFNFLATIRPVSSDNAHCCAQIVLLAARPARIFAP